MSQPIAGTTGVVALLGDPVHHSRSPAMHNAAFRACGLDLVYVALPVARADVAAAIDGLRALGLVGANVTVPHKRAVMPHLGELTPDAERVGAVNTIWRDENGELHGDNTDAAGLRRHLEAVGVAFADRRVLLLGAGGAAPAAIAGLEAAAEIAVSNRTPERALALVERLEGRVAADLRTVDWTARGEALGEFDLVVNATSVGMTGQDPSATPLPDLARLSRQAVVYDMVYTPRPTRLLRDASARGARTVDGLGMLLHQGALAFERWTGESAPLDVMRHALDG